MRQPHPRFGLWADFLAKYQEYEDLIAQNADLNWQKRTWSKKRQLGLKPPKRPRGAQPGNRNAYKHGFDTRERRLASAMFRAFFRATEAAKRRPRSAPACGL